MTGISYDIVIKDFATGALSKLQKSSLKTEGAVRKMMRSLPEGSKTATPSIDSLRFRLEKLNEGKNASFDTRQIRRFNGAIRKTERQLRKLKDLPPLSVGERFRKLGGSIASLIPSAVGFTAGLGAITGAFTSAISAGAGFEKEMSNVKALTGASGESFEALNATARQLGATTAFSAREAAEGMSFLAQAGFDTNQITAALPATLNLAAAGSVTLGQAADISSNILSGFGLQAEQTGRVVDVMAKATSTSNTNITEMGEAMKFFAPTAKVLGISLEESSAAVGLLGNAGIKGSLATQSLGSAFTRLAKGGGEVGKVTKALGLNLFKDGQFVGIANAVGQLEGAFAGMTQQQKAANLSTLFGQEAFKNIAVLVDSGSEKIRDYTDELRNSRGVAEEIADTKLDNLTGDWSKLKSAVGELGLSLYNSLRPRLRQVVGILSSATAVLMKMGGWVKKNIGWIKALAVGIGTYVGVMKVASLWTGIVTKAKAMWAAVSAVATLRQKGLTRATMLATIKERIFQRVLMGNPYMAIAAAVIALGVAVAVYAGSVNNVSAAQQAQLDVAQKVKESTIEERTQAEMLLSIFKDHTSTAVQKTGAYQKLNDLYPSIMGKYKDEKTALEHIDTAQNDIIESIGRRARAEASFELLKESEREILRLEAAGPDFIDIAKGVLVGAILGRDSGKEGIKNSHERDLEELTARKDKRLEIYKKATNEQLTAEATTATLKKEKLVADPAAADADKVGSTENPNGIKESADAIVTGGKRQQIYNINIEKVLEMGDQIITNGKEQADDIVDILLEGLIRRLSGTFRQAGN